LDKEKDENFLNISNLNFDNFLRRVKSNQLGKSDKNKNISAV
jgi:hypothetical protein